MWNSWPLLTIAAEEKGFQSSQPHVDSLLPVAPTSLAVFPLKRSALPH